VRQQALSVLTAVLMHFGVGGVMLLTQGKFMTHTPTVNANIPLLPAKLLHMPKVLALVAMCHVCVISHTAQVPPNTYPSDSL